MIKRLSTTPNILGDLSYLELRRMRYLFDMGFMRSSEAPMCCFTAIACEWDGVVQIIGERASVFGQIAGVYFCWIYCM